MTRFTREQLIEMGGTPVSQEELIERGIISTPQPKRFTREELIERGGTPVRSTELLPKQPQQPTTTKGIGTYIPGLTSVATAYQAAREGTAGVLDKGSQKQIIGSLENQRKAQHELLELYNKETDPTRKKNILKNIEIISKGLLQGAKSLGQMAHDTKEETRINLPGFKVPPIPDEGTGKAITGRSIKSGLIGASPMLGPAGFFAGIGTSQALEEDRNILPRSPKEFIPFGESLGISEDESVTAKGVKWALGGKLAGATLGGIAKTEVGQRIGASPIGSAVSGTLSKIYTPLIATPAKAGTLGAEVDKAVMGVGKAINKLVSPSTYYQPFGKIGGYLGQKTGVLRTPEQKTQQIQKKVEDFWTTTQSRYKKLTEYGGHSPQILSREGIPPAISKDGKAIITGDQQEIIRLKAASENVLLNSLLDKSGVRIASEKARSQAVNQLTNGLSGNDREMAIRWFNKEFNTFLAQNKSSILVDQGEKMIPVRLVNDFKSYLWSKGFAGKIAPASDQLRAKAARIAGNAYKEHIISETRLINPELSTQLHNLNKHLGELYQAENFLKAVNGAKPNIGFMTRQFGKITGTIAGGFLGGFPGAMAGNVTTEQLMKHLADPKLSTGEAAKLLYNVQQQNPEVYKQGMKMLQDLIINQHKIVVPITETASPILLPAAKSVKGATPSLEALKTQQPKAVRAFGNLKTDVMNQFKSMKLALKEMPAERIAAQGGEKGMIEVVRHNLLLQVRTNPVNKAIADKIAAIDINKMPTLKAYEGAVRRILNI